MGIFKLNTAAAQHFRKPQLVNHKTLKAFRLLLKPLDAKFTIEAAVIIPLTFVIIAWFIVQAFNIHNRTVEYSNAVSAVIQNSVNSSMEHVSKPSHIQSDSGNGNSNGIIGAFEGSGKDYSNIINTENLDGRKVLLKYKLAKDGIKKLTGGLSDED